jgi:uncharacterized protein YjbI with pentapeptide repeats
MSRQLLITVLTGTIVFSIMPDAQAGRYVNGVALNGVSLNGTSFNGASLNGTSFNGSSINGGPSNGDATSGTTRDFADVLRLTRIILPSGIEVVQR